MGEREEKSVSGMRERGVSRARERGDESGTGEREECEKVREMGVIGAREWWERERGGSGERENWQREG